MSAAQRTIGTAGTKGCKLGCLYCFTRDADYERAKRLDELRTRDLLDETEDADVVQPLCDTEFLLLPDWKNYLDELISTNKIISFATKAVASEDDVRVLGKLNEVLMHNGRFLHVGVTIVKLRDWQGIEPKAPSPEQRVQTLRRLWEVGVPTNVLVRPMMPFTTLDELEELTDRTYRFCHGYVSGPLYLTPAMKTYLARKHLSFPTTARTANWLTGSPTKEAIESPELEKALAQFAEVRGRQLFPGNVEAINAIRDFTRQTGSGDRRWDSSLRREPVATVYVINPKTHEFLLLFHRKLGAWLPPGGHVDFGESPLDAARREAEEELGIQLAFLPLDGQLAQHGKDFRCLPQIHTTGAFCTIEEYIRPIGLQDPHIHVDSIFVARVSPPRTADKHNPEEVTARDWFPFSKIKTLQTFDNIPLVCQAILRAMESAQETGRNLM